VGSRSFLKGAGISNIEYRYHEFRSDDSQFMEQKKIEHNTEFGPKDIFEIAYSRKD